jgi:hypothetical protein
VAVSLDDVGKREFFTLPGLELRSLGCPAHSSQYTDCTIRLSTHTLGGVHKVKVCVTSETMNFEVFIAVKIQLLI